MLVGDGTPFDGGIYYYGRPPRNYDTADDGAPAVSDPAGKAHRMERFLNGMWKTHYDLMQAHLAELKRELPPQYTFLHGMRDSAKPANIKVHIRGEETNLGEEAPRRFLQILCDGEPTLFTKGSGRLELAEAIASPANPLTSR